MLWVGSPAKVDSGMFFTFFDFGDKKGRQLLAHCDQSTVSFSVFGFSNLLAANSILCCLRTASPQGIAALAAQGGVAPLTEQSDETFSVGHFFSADRE